MTPLDALGPLASVADSLRSIPLDSRAEAKTSDADNPFSSQPDSHSGGLKKST